MLVRIQYFPLSHSVVSMIQILLGSILLSLVHAAIPNHWIPLVAIGRAQRWSHRETLWVTVVVGLAHILSTVAIGALVGLVGLQLAHEYEEAAAIIAPTVLVLLGIVYIVLDFRHHRHKHIHTESLVQKSRAAVIASLSFAMFFSPCLEITGFYLSAGVYGVIGIVVVSLVYLLVTVLGMVLLVYIGMKSIERVRWSFLEHHEKAVGGVVLIVLGVLAYFSGGHIH